MLHESSASNPSLPPPPRRLARPAMRAQKETVNITDVMAALSGVLDGSGY